MKFSKILTMAVAALLVLGAFCSCDLCPHENTEWRTALEATCAAEGTRASVCKDCGAVVTQEAIPAIDHTWGELIDETLETNNQAGVKAHYECSGCSAVSLDANEVCAAEDIYMSSEGLVYTLQPDDTYHVTGYTGKNKNVVIPKAHEGKAVTGVGERAFDDNNKIKSIIIPNSITSIGKYAFYKCNSLTSVSLPDSVTSLGEGAFDNCNSLKEATVGGGVTSLEEGVFKRCSSLKALTLPAGITVISESVFNHCTSLKDVYYGGTENEWKQIIVKSDNDLLSKATIHYLGKELEEKGGLIFELQADGTYHVVGYDGNNVIVVIPDTYNDEDVTGINVKTVGSFVSFSGIVIPDSITSINCSAFESFVEFATVYYIGTAEQWENISLQGGDLLNYENLYYYSEAEPTAEGNFWHYIDGVPSIWSVHSGATEEIGLLYELQEDGTYWVVGYTGIITDVVIPATYEGKAVTGVGKSAFNRCSSIKCVTIPNSIKVIDKGAFANCANLTNITIPASVESIERTSFAYCISLESIEVEKGNKIYHSTGNCLIETQSKTLVLGCKNSIIPDDGSVIEISIWAFHGCSGLTSINIPGSVEFVGSRAFYGCNNLTSVIISEGFKAIGKESFMKCNRLVSIVLPNSLEVISSRAFYGCSSLASIAIPDGVVGIDSSAFAECSSLISIEMSENVIVIRSDAFSGCTNLSNVYYNGTAEQWAEIEIASGNEALLAATVHYLEKDITEDEETNGFIFELQDDGTYRVVGYEGEITDVVIPATYKGKAVTRIGERAFVDCDSLVSIVISNSIESIGSYAFRNCNKLASIVIPDSITSIGSYAFSNCTSLINVAIPDSVINIASAAFRECRSLTNIVVADNNPTYKSIDGNLYTKDEKALVCYAIGKKNAKFIIPDGVTSIGDGAFYGCTSLSSVEIPTSVTSIGAQAFRMCTNFVSIVIPDSVTRIDSSAFRECTSLTSIVIPSGVEYIRDTFHGCISLTSVEIPNSVTHISRATFADCASLSDVYYTGTEEEWALIIIENDNEYLNNATIHYNYVP